jgi:hypothetical protein
MCELYEKVIFIGHQRLTLITLATQEAEIRKIAVQTQLGK